MTMSSLPSNPYQPPCSSDDSMSADWATPASRPGGLTAVCVIAIVLGALGLLGSLFGLASLAAQPWMQKTFAMQRQPGTNEKFVKANNEMQQKIQAVTQRYWGINVGIALVNILVAAGLLVGGIMTMKLNPKARTFLIAIFATAIVFEIIRACIYIFLQLELAPIMLESMPHIMGASAPKGQPGAEQAAAMGAVIAKVSIALGMVFSLGFGLAKIIFYGIGASYLRRPRIRKLFQPTATGGVY